MDDFEKIKLSKADIENIKNFIIWELDNKKPCNSCPDNYVCRVTDDYSCSQIHAWNIKAEFLPGFSLWNDPKLSTIVSKIKDVVKAKIEESYYADKANKAIQRYMDELDSGKYIMEE